MVSNRHLDMTRAQYFEGPENDQSCDAIASLFRAAADWCEQNDPVVVALALDYHSENNDLTLTVCHE